MSRVEMREVLQVLLRVRWQLRREESQQQLKLVGMGRKVQHLKVVKVKSWRLMLRQNPQAISQRKGRWSSLHRRQRLQAVRRRVVQHLLLKRRASLQQHLRSQQSRSHQQHLRSLPPLSYSRRRRRGVAVRLQRVRSLRLRQKQQLLMV
jgi:hypothetical protein